MHKVTDRIIRDFRLRPVLRALPHDARRVLDIGCGPRPWVLDLDPPDRMKLEAFGVDQRPYALEDIPGFSFQAMDAHAKLPFRDDEFDVVTMLAVIEHLYDPKIALAEAYRVLSPGGLFMATTPSVWAKPVLEFLAFWLHLIDEDEIRDHKQYFTPKTLESLVSSQGFPVRSSKYFEFGFNVFTAAVKES